MLFVCVFFASYVVHSFHSSYFLLERITNSIAYHTYRYWYCISTLFSNRVRTQCNAQLQQQLNFADELACSKDDLSALCELLGWIKNDSRGAELFETLNNGAYTVFAPNDEAFLDLQGLDISDTDKVIDVLLYHAVPDNKVFAKDLECDSTLQMANGGETLTQCEDGNFFQVGNLNDGRLPQIVEADLSTCTGVVHVVDKIALPSPCTSICTYSAYRVSTVMFRLRLGFEIFASPALDSFVLDVLKYNY